METFEAREERCEIWYEFGFDKCEQYRDIQHQASYLYRPGRCFSMHG
jgi:hypothetical protein